MTQDGDVPLAQLAAIIETDPRMTLQVLRVANSAAMARRRPAETAQEAVVAIGMEETARIAIGCSLLLDLGIASPDLPLDAVLNHGLLVARAWKPFGAAAATSGILANGPLLALTRDAPSFARYSAAVEATSDYEELHNLETATWGLTRCEIADQLADVWHLPFSITEELSGWHACRSLLPGRYEAFSAASLESPNPLLRAFASR